MVKKIVSVMLALVLLLMAAFMLVLMAYDLLLAVQKVVYLIDNGIRHYHQDVQGHYYHNYYYRDNSTLVNLNFVNGQSYLKNEVMCAIATTFANWAEFFKDASIIAGFFSLAILVLSCISSKSKNLVKTISKVLLILSFLGIFASNLVIGFVDSAVWIRTVIAILQNIKEYVYGFESAIAFVVYFVKFNVLRIDNYVYALAAILGVAFVASTMLSKKAKTPKNAKPVSQKTSDACVNNEPSVSSNQEVKPEASQATSYASYQSNDTPAYEPAPIRATPNVQSTSDEVLGDDESDFFIVQK